MSGKPGPWKPLQHNTERMTVTEEHEFPYIARFAYEPGKKGDTHWVDFAIYRTVAEGDEPLYPNPGCTGSGDWTSDLDAAGPDVCGFVKWDGCTQFEFPEGCHFDDREDMERLWNAINLARRVALTEIIGAKQHAKEYT